MSVDIKIVRSDGKKGFDIIPALKVQTAKHSIKDILDDISDEAFIIGQEIAPISSQDDKEGSSTKGVPPSGTLKEHPLDIDKSGFGTAEAKALQFGGEGVSIRAPAGAVDPLTGKKIGGQFVPGTAPIGSSHLFYNIAITYPKEPFYAKYVAFGTGVFGQYHTPIVSPTAKIMKFRYQGKAWRAAVIQGQEPQPYLDDVAAHLDSYYIPLKMGQLRAEIDTIF